MFLLLLPLLLQLLLLLLLLPPQLPLLLPLPLPLFSRFLDHLLLSNGCFGRLDNGHGRSSLGAEAARERKQLGGRSSPGAEAAWGPKQPGGRSSPGAEAAWGLAQPRKSRLDACPCSGARPFPSAAITAPDEAGPATGRRA